MTAHTPDDAFMRELPAALDLLVIERLDDSALFAHGPLPAWVERCGFSCAPGPLPDGAFDAFPFLANFLVDAEAFWAHQSCERLRSGLWFENDPKGDEHAFEASALCLGPRRLLLVEMSTATFVEKREIIQAGREVSVAFARLARETDKKEILFHCIVHDLAGPLTVVMGNLAMLGREDLSPRGRRFAEQGLAQGRRLQALIQDVLDVFVAESGALADVSALQEAAPDAVACAREAAHAAALGHQARDVRVTVDPGPWSDRPCHVRADGQRLERVLWNLVENALRHSPAGGSVTVAFAEDGDDVVVTVEDEGPGVADDVARTLFEKFSRGRGAAGKAGLGLYFCRITVERWGGSIAYAPREGGGASFRFRLPRVDTP